MGYQTLAVRASALALLCLGIPATRGAALAAEGLVRTILADRTGLVLELLVPPPELSARRGAEGSTYDHVQVPGWATTTAVGCPELPLQAVLLQVPLSGAVDVEVDQSPRLSLHVPALARVDSPGEAVGGGSCGPAGLYPGSPFRLSAREILRGTPVMRLTLHPFQWNSGTGELLYTTSMTVRVRFREPLPGAAADVAQSAAALRDPPVSTVQQAAGGKVRLRMEIGAEGFYRVTGRNLTRAGVNLRAIDPRTLKVFNRGRAVPIQVFSRSPRRFTARDSLEFYAQGLSNTFTGTNVYWLGWGGRRGARIGTVNGRVPDGGEIVASFPERLRFEENHTMWENMPGAPDQDYWFWQKLQAPAAAAYTLTLPSPHLLGADASLALGLRGRTSQEHLVRCSLNGVAIGEVAWSGTGEQLQELTVPRTLLAAGTNELRLELPGGAGLDIVYLNRIDMSYTRTAEAGGIDLSATFPAGGPREARISRLTRPSIRVYDVTDPYRVWKLRGVTVAPDGEAYQARFRIGSSAAKTYRIIAKGAARTPSRMRLWRRPANFAQPANGADYILVAPRSFLHAAEPLCSLRRQQGLRVVTAAMEDIYNLYSYGLPDPLALKRFVANAYRTWKRPAPAYVFLLGDANTDYRDYFGTGKKNAVPVHLSATAGMGVTPDDNWYVAVDGDDDLPDLFIGRVTVRDPEAAAAVVAKIVGYERSAPPYAANALLVADNNETGFQVLADDLAGRLPAGIAAQRVYLPPTVPEAEKETVRLDLRSRINAGTLLAAYVGHGDVTGWAGERLLDTTTVPRLDNAGRLPFVVTLDCLNGYFSQPFSYSLGELLANIPDKGSIASFSPSGFGYLWEHELLGKELFSLAFSENVGILGKIATTAKVRAYAAGASIDLVKTFTLLGDPASRLRMPATSQ